MHHQKRRPRRSLLFILAASLISAGLLRIEAVAQTPPSVPSRPSIGAQRSGHSTTVLADGRVLLAGGRVEVAGTLVWMPAAGVFDPSVGRLTATGDLVTVREQHSATRLKDGRVLIAGGMGPGGAGREGPVPLASAEIYAPATGRFTATGNLTRARASHAAELLPTGQVLITGGEVPASKTVTAEVYDPATGRFSATRVKK